MKPKTQVLITGIAFLALVIFFQFSGSGSSTKHSRHRMESRITMLEERIRMLEQKIIKIDQAVMHPEVKILPVK